MKSLFLLLAALLSTGCANFNRTEHQRALEQLEEFGAVVTITGDSAFATADKVEERGGIWLRKNSALKFSMEGADTLQSEPPPLDEFGYRIIRYDSLHLTRLMVEQRSFSDYFSGFNARRLAYYMATSSDIDSTSEPIRPSLTSYYFQLAGEGVFLSLNFERILFPYIAARIGIGIESHSMGPEDAEIDLVVPTGISWISSDNSGVELGIGATFLFGIRNPPDVNPLFGFASIGYRYAPSEGGMVVRVTFTPNYTLRGSEYLKASYLGVGLGHTL
jgi:hypothetical protein